MLSEEEVKKIKKELSSFLGNSLLHQNNIYNNIKIIAK